VGECLSDTVGSDGADPVFTLGGYVEGSLETSPTQRLSGPIGIRSYDRAKRITDLFIASVGSFVAAPVMVAVAIGIRVSMGSPILFKQLRAGLNEQPFTCLKFRTMMDGIDENGRPLPDVQRTTRFGRLLRRTSLDELPQLWNILTGELSVVGPRPLLARYLSYYTATERRRHCVLPGLTGWAQIHGRNGLSFDERLQMDVWYVNNRSWWLDMSIILKTVLIIISQRGYGTDTVTLDELRTGASQGRGDATGNIKTDKSWTD
jgi:sugar transferase EpsL